jgi:Raf kinase inhibitor-like YbhB/YbcL family protein
MKLTSTAFIEGAPIPERFTCEADDVSPALAWTNAPAGTKSFALICDDPDAPGKTWVHWVVWGIPESATALPEGFTGASQGMTDSRRAGYSGPCPPPGKPHRYFFKLYALSSALSLPPRATKADLERAMEGRIMATATLMGTFARS